MTRKWKSPIGSDAYPFRHRNGGQELQELQKPGSTHTSTLNMGAGYTLVISFGPTDQMRSLKISTSDQFLTTEEAAEFLKVPKQSILNMTSNGTLKCTKLGRRNRYKLSDLNQLLLTSNEAGGSNAD